MTNKPLAASPPESERIATKCTSTSTLAAGRFGCSLGLRTSWPARALVPANGPRFWAECLQRLWDHSACWRRWGLIAGADVPFARAASTDTTMSDRFASIVEARCFGIPFPIDRFPIDPINSEKRTNRRRNRSSRITENVRGRTIAASRRRK